MKLTVALVVLSLFLQACAPPSANQSPTEETNAEVDPGFLPAEWYALNNSEISESKSKGQDTSKNLDLAVDAILEAQSRALSKVNEPSLLSMGILSHPGDWVPWRFVAFIAELGVSVSGLIGSLTGKGAPSVQVYWEKKSESVISALAATELSITNEMTESQIQQQIEPVLASLLSGRKIEDEAALRKNLKQAVVDFQQIMSLVSEQPHQSWFFSRFRVDLSIAASGFVSLAPITVGVEAKIRLEWYRTTKKISGLQKANLTQYWAHNDSSLFGPIKDLDLFIQNMASDFSEVTAGLSLGNDFQLDEFQIGLGGSIKGDIGVAKGKAKLLGIAYFNRQTAIQKQIVTVDSETGSTEMNLIESGVFKISRKHWRKGLSKAVKMGQYFADRAAQRKNKNWIISKIKPGFDISITGGIGIVTVSGDLVSQLVFKNKNF